MGTGSPDNLESAMREDKKDPPGEPQERNLLNGWWAGIESRRVALRRLGWLGVAVFLAGSGAATLRFFFPRVLFEPPSKFKVGKPSEYAPGSVSTQHVESHRIWIVRSRDGAFFCLHARCTHLGCTPNWLEAQDKFKCPCHGSGFYATGENFEGPAPKATRSV